jgi:prepilin-type N-terminal cleavage/methylation domain-containing protein
MNKKGFTLIELVMVIVIIGILAAIAIPRFMDLRRDARQASCQATGGAIRGALSSYYASTALRTSTPRFPGSISDLNSYMQTSITPPLAGASWDTYYTSGTGVVNVDTACTPP